MASPDRSLAAAEATDAEAMHLLRALTTGDMMVKHKHNATTHRFVCASHDTQHLIWSKSERDFLRGKFKGMVAVADVIEVRAGLGAGHRTSALGSAPSANCFSVVTNERTLDLEAHTPEQAQLWVAGLEYLTSRRGLVPDGAGRVPALAAVSTTKSSKRRLFRWKSQGGTARAPQAGDRHSVAVNAADDEHGGRAVAASGAAAVVFVDDGPSSPGSPPAASPPGSPPQSQQQQQGGSTVAYRERIAVLTATSERLTKVVAELVGGMRGCCRELRELWPAEDSAELAYRESAVWARDTAVGTVDEARQLVAALKLERETFVGRSRTLNAMEEGIASQLRAKLEETRGEVRELTRQRDVFERVQEAMRSYRTARSTEAALQAELDARNAEILELTEALDAERTLRAALMLAAGDGYDEEAVRAALAAVEGARKAPPGPGPAPVAAAAAAPGGAAAATAPPRPRGSAPPGSRRLGKAAAAVRRSSAIPYAFAPGTAAGLSPASFSTICAAIEEDDS